MYIEAYVLFVYVYQCVCTIMYISVQVLLSVYINVYVS